MDKNWSVTYKIIGRASATVQAETITEAWEKANQLDIEDGELLEWEYGDPTDIELD